MRSRGQPTPIRVGEPQPTSTKLTPQQPVLFDEVRDDIPLSAIQPAGQHHQHHLQRGEVDHEPELISRLTRRTSADLRNTARSTQSLFGPAHWTVADTEVAGERRSGVRSAE